MVGSKLVELEVPQHGNANSNAVPACFTMALTVPLIVPGIFDAYSIVLVLYRYCAVYLTVEFIVQ